MGKESGLGAAYYVDGIEVSGDTQSFERIANILSTLPMTGIDKFAMERKPGALNGEINWTAFFNPATDETHDTLGALPRTDRIVTYCHKRAGAMIPAASMVAKQLSYDPNRSMDGALLFKVNSSCNGYTLDWGYTVTNGQRTDTAATDGTGRDFNGLGGGSAFGLQAFLHVLAFTGTSAVVKLQESSDNGSSDAWADVTGGAFAAVTTAPQGQRIATARDLTVERYLRVVTTGTFSNLVFLVQVNVNRVVNNP